MSKQSKKSVIIMAAGPAVGRQNMGYSMQDFQRPIEHGSFNQFSGCSDVRSKSCINRFKVQKFVLLSSPGFFDSWLNKEG